MLISSIAAVSLFGGSPHIGAPAHTSCNQASSAKEFRQFSAKVWSLDRWERKRPKQSTLKAQRRQLACAGPANKRAIKKTWRRDQRAFYKHRKRMLWIKRVTPYYGCTPNGGCHWWALPAYIPACESGGDYFVGFAGAYGLLTATWQQWGGSALVGTNDAGEAPPWAQDVIAHRVWEDVGPPGWECA